MPLFISTRHLTTTMFQQLIILLVIQENTTTHLECILSTSCG